VRILKSARRRAARQERARFGAAGLPACTDARANGLASPTRAFFSCARRRAFGLPSPVVTPRMVLLFVCTLFLSSSLLFLVQPMIAKMVLPLLGGTPAVWNTCMVFFQAALLLGYLYVHAVTRWLRLAQQAALHAALLVVSLATLPIALAAHDEPPADGLPILWLVRVLVVSVGVPFFVVSTTGPLLQRWFARSGRPGAGDPYFLSVAGNIGSIIALLAYPAALERTLRLADQSRLWTIMYASFAVLMIASIAAVRRQSLVGSQESSVSRESPVGSQESEHDRESRVGQSTVGSGLSTRDSRLSTLDSRLSTTNAFPWLALSFIPSSLMLGLTTYLTTDVAPVPLFWVLPLTLYLASFALVFARRVIIPHTLMVRLLPMLALVLVTVIVFASQLPPPIQAPLHLVTFFVAAMVCHGELARTRPDGAQLTAFYLCMSAGGVLGGLFNALVAPIAFRTVVEYPLAIVLACAARPTPESLLGFSRFAQFSGFSRFGGFARTSNSKNLENRANRENPVMDVLVPVGIALMLAVPSTFSRTIGNPVPVLIVYAALTLFCYSLKNRPLRFALSLGALMIGSSVYVGAHQPVEYQGRSYFSVYKVATDPLQHLRVLVHGRIIHGAQSLDPSRRGEPLTYYHRTGPIGHAFATFTGRFAKPRVGIVGLGAGSLAAYAEAGQRWTFYEIDPSIAALARNPRYFTYLHDARTEVRIVLGDARLSLARESAGSLDLLVVDAFGSDTIPVHLLTREALALYFTDLQPHGVLALHISNRYLDLRPLLGDLARDAGLELLAEEDTKLPEAELLTGKAPSTWVVIARTREDLGALAADARWHPLPPCARATVWTDDFSNPLSVMRWF
jgi:hypothetical protein